MTPGYMLIKKIKNDKGALLVIFSIVIYALVFTWLSILRYQSFFSVEWEDQATMHQLVWNTAYGNWFVNSIGISGYYFSYHFQPIIFFQGMIYRIFPHIYNHFFITTFFLASAALPLYFISKRLLENKIAAFIISLAYLLYTPLHNINFSDLDPVVLTIPILFCILAFIVNDRRDKQSSVAIFFLVVLALMCKEHLGFTIGLLGVFLMFRRDIRWGLILIVTAVVWLSISLPITLGLNHGQSLARSINYGSFGEIVFMPLKNPRGFFEIVFSANHADYILKVFSPLGFLPLFSLISLVAVPDLALLLCVKGNIEYYQAYFIAPAIPFLFVGTVYSIKKIAFFVRKREGGRLVSVIICSVILFLNVANLFSRNILGDPKEGKVIYDNKFASATNIFDPVFYAIDKEDGVARDLIAMIPQGASVAASGDLLVALSNRSCLLELFNEEYDYCDVDYILIHTKYIGFGAGDYCMTSPDKIARFVKDLEDSQHWQKLKADGEFILFRRKAITHE